MRFKVSILSMVIVLILSLSGCISVEIIDDESGNMNIYSREANSTYFINELFYQSWRKILSCAVEHKYALANTVCRTVHTGSPFFVFIISPIN